MLVRRLDACQRTQRIGNRPRARRDGLELGERFGDVRHHRHALGLSKRIERGKDSGCDRIRTVGRNAESHERRCAARGCRKALTKCCDHPFCISIRAPKGLQVHDRTEPSLAGSSDSGPRIRRVRNGSNPRLQTEQRTERSSSLDIARGEPGPPGNVIGEPVTEREPVTKAAIGGVVQVRVRVDECWQQHGRTELFMLSIRERTKHLCSRTDCNDQTILHCNRTLP